MADIDRARTAKLRLRRELDGRPGVRGIGLARAEDGYHLRVSVATSADAAALPATVDGVAVHVRVVGAVRPLG
ncbi:hypothetical protein FA014_12440 [Cellulomonas hominis]|uniref:BON domain-containing protein n=1 Tax=Cellulomonas hominis TaxID=156981 RepID=A0A7Z8NPL7_9CELL|nr:hypothetical protein [Cellulomonas hominis]TKR23209.1 hypothetical protein FA014_12440 [Cellulomonas hominis]